MHQDVPVKEMLQHPAPPCAPACALVSFLIVCLFPFPGKPWQLKEPYARIAELGSIRLGTSVTLL